MFKLVDTPAALPGSCFFCGSASRKSYIDTGHSIEFHGALYICVDECLREMAALAMFESPAVVQTLKGILQSNAELILEQSLTIEGLKKVIDGYSSLNINSGLVTPPDGRDGVGSDPPEPELPRGETELGSGETDTPEPSNDEGVAVVPPSSGSGELEFSLDL